MSYQCLAQAVVHSLPYSIEALRIEDIFLIKKWRNEQMDVLRQKSMLTDEGQKRYYSEVVQPGFKEEQPKMILFSYLRMGSCIGYGGLTNIDWEAGRAEISFLVDTERTKDAQVYEDDFVAFLTLMKKVAFQDLHFNRLFTETFDIRPAHIAVLEKCGFIREGRMRKHARVGQYLVDSLIHGCLKEI